MLYLNPNWGENDYGETAFFETNTDDTELVTEVRPRYGRVCIFDGTIPHSARPPSPRFTGGRYTLAVKMASSKFRASANLFREISQHEDGLKSVERFLTVLEQGKLTESVDKYMYRVPSEQHLNKLERGIMLDKEDEDEDDKDKEDNGFDEDNADDDGFHDEPEQPGSTQFSKEEQETIAFLEGDEEDYHKHVDRIVQSSNGDEEAIARAIANSDNNFDQTSERIKNRLEALI